jgi:hypothetical protein
MIPWLWHRGTLRSLGLTRHDSVVCDVRVCWKPPPVNWGLDWQSLLLLLLLRQLPTRRELTISITINYRNI